MWLAAAVLEPFDVGTGQSYGVGSLDDVSGRPFDPYEQLVAASAGGDPCRMLQDEVV